MKFNVSKCNILSSATHRSPLLKFYQLNNIVLYHVEATKYLGILIHQSLNFDAHIQQIVSKANSKLGFLKRNLRGCPGDLKRSAYIGLVRSGLEYGSIIWDPHYGTQKKKIELVQNNAMRWIQGLPPFDQTKIKSLLADTGLDSLEHRRRDARVTMLYKMVHGLVNMSPEELGLEPADQRTRASHRHKFKDRGSHSNQLKFSFCQQSGS